MANRQITLRNRNIQMQRRPIRNLSGGLQMAHASGLDFEHRELLPRCLQASYHWIRATSATQSKRLSLRSIRSFSNQNEILAKVIKTLKTITVSKKATRHGEIKIEVPVGSNRMPALMSVYYPILNQHGTTSMAHIAANLRLRANLIPLIHPSADRLVGESVKMVNSCEARFSNVHLQVAWSILAPEDHWNN